MGRMAGIMRQARLLPRALGAQGQRQASFLGGIFGSGEKKAGIATEATFDYHPFKLHHLDEGPATSTTITREDGLRLYHQMVTVRRMETAAANLYKEKAIRGFCHLCSVQKKGPLVFEISTYRYHGHSMSDPGTSYRTRDEVQEVRQTRDPITGFRDRLVGAELAEVSELKAIDIEVKKSVDEDVKKAKTDSEIGAEELFYDVYEKNIGGKIRGIAPWDQHEHKKTQA